MEIIINSNSSEPIYYQIYRQLKKSIENKQIKPNEQLPTERDLCRKSGVSRITIRKAIKDLVSEGVCYKKKGKGIFVSKEKILFELQTMMGTSNYIASLGLKIKTSVILKKIINSNVQIEEKLNLSNKSKILFLKRLRIIDDEPLMVESTNLSLNRMPGLDKFIFTGSLYKIIREKFNLLPNYSKGFLIHKLADEENAKLLNIPLNNPIMRKQVVVYSKDDIPIEFITTDYRSDRFKFLFHEFCQ